MRRFMVLAVCGLLISATAAMAKCGKCGKGATVKAEAAEKSICAPGDELHVCAKCKTVAKKDKKCPKCKKDMGHMRVLVCQDGSATLCPCAKDCKCTLKADDPTKCSCDKDVVTVSVKKLSGGKRAKAKASE